jgi:hypothetical protein
MPTRTDITMPTRTDNELQNTMQKTNTNSIKIRR